MPIVTDRLELVPTSLELLHTAQEGDDALARALDVALPASWPPEFYGSQSLTYTLDRLTQDPKQQGWLLHWFILREPRTLIGYGGYKGAPRADGTIEVGYAIVDEHSERATPPRLPPG